MEIELANIPSKVYLTLDALQLKGPEAPAPHQQN